MSMIYPQSHLPMESTIMTPTDAKSPSCGLGQSGTVRQPPVVLAGSAVGSCAGRDSVAKENGSGLGVSPGSVPSSASAAGAVPIDDDGELRLEVTCGQNQAILYTGRLQLGSKGTCVLFENAWLTPNEFQYVSGRETAKDWKRSIKHHGKSLKVLIAKGILTTSPPARCDCGQCSSSPRKPSSDGALYNTPSGEGAKQHPSDGAEGWRSVTHSSSTSDSASAAASGSAFRPPPEATSSSVAYRSSDCAVAADRLSVNGTAVDDAYASRSSSGPSKSNGTSGGELSHSASTTSSSSTSSSPDSRSKKSLSSNNNNGTTKRPRSPSADASLDHPPAKHHMSDNHGSESASGRSGEHQSRLAYGSDSSSRSQRQQFSPSADSGSRRREQSQSSSNGQCRSAQSSGNFKSPSAPSHHHYQNGTSGGSQQQSSTQKSSPASGITASTGSSSDPSCVISPLAATPYFPFLAAAAAVTSTAAQLPSTPVCYPNPYMMLPLAAAAAAYQTPSAVSAAQFSAPYGWNPSTVSSAASVVDQVASRHAAGSASMASNGPAFDFPWMRGGGCGAPTGSSSSYSSKLSPPPSVMSDPYELAKQSAAFGLATAAPNAYSYRGSTTAAAAAAAGFGGLFAAAADGLDAYDNYLRSSFKVATPHLTSAAAAAAAAGFQQSLFEGQHSAAAAAGFGVYPPLFQTPYFGIPSR